MRRNKSFQPSLFLTMAEWQRALLELLFFLVCFPFWRPGLKGSRQPVLVIPGFLTNDLVTWPLRKLLAKFGYLVFGWNQGVNWGYDEYLGAELYKKLMEIYENCEQQKVIIIGWSLGGTYAKVIAKMYPQLVLCVITLGAPIKIPDRTLILWVFEKLSGRIRNLDKRLFHFLKAQPAVPVIAIYSPTNGYLPQEFCKEENAVGVKYIPVLSSHSGLGHNPFSIREIFKNLKSAEILSG